MRNWNHVLEKNGRSLPWAARKWLKYENKLDDRIIKQLLNSVIAKYRDLSVSRRSRYFAQPRAIIVKCLAPLETPKMFGGAVRYASRPSTQFHTKIYHSLLLWIPSTQVSSTRAQLTSNSFHLHQELTKAFIYPLSYISKSRVQTLPYFEW